MNINTVKKAIPYLFKQNIVPNLIGVHGTGKSTCIREYCEEQNIGFIDLRLGQMEVGDLLGLPEITDDGEGNKITVFARPKWFPTEGRGVLFLDEINRSKRDVIQAVFQLVLDRKLHDYALPSGWSVVAAQNPNSEDYQTLDLSDKAFLDRFCHIKITSSYEDFIKYGNDKGFNKSVLNFISSHPAMLRGANAAFTLDYVQPSDRSWAAVSRLVEDKTTPDDILNELITGLVGTEAATAYMSWKKTAEKPVDGIVVMKDYAKVKKTVKDQSTEKNYRPDMLNETKQQIMEYIKSKKEDEELDNKEFGNLVAFMMDIPNDLFVEFVKQMLKQPKLFLRLSENTDLHPKIDICLAEKESTVEEKDKAKA